MVRWWADQVVKLSFRAAVFLVLFAAPGGITAPDYLHAPPSRPAPPAANSQPVLDSDAPPGAY